ncbi:hypothetical protein KI688_006519 [Linnemannia hyalina]|uniref:F-box domain-containing protein n=1 Tax=Linnemannia hyalina TaxID=64524 RepID=A0A9P8BQR7_9FUNG|nr:hypothetical protein KI688_006519 [Linnemannia hyalina]
MSKTPSSDRALCLPELLAQIAAHLTPPDLSACSQVSRFWNDNFTPPLWHTINDRDYNWPKLVGSDSKYVKETGSWIPISTGYEDMAREMFLKHGHHIRHLSASNWTVLRALAESGDSLQLRTLWFRLPFSRTTTTANRPAQLPEDMDEKDKEVLEGILQPDVMITQEFDADTWRLTWQLWLLILRTPALCNLKMSKYRMFAQVLSSAFLRRALSVHHRTLTTLQISHRQLGLVDCLEVLPNLRHFYTAYNPMKVRLLHKTYTQLRSLFIHAPVSEPAFFNLLRHLPGLEIFSVSKLLDVLDEGGDDDSDWGDDDDSDWGDDDSEADYNDEAWDTDVEVSSLLDGVPSHLPKLYILTRYREIDLKMLHIVSRILPCLPFLTELSIDAEYPYLGPLLAKQCPQLEAFRSPASISFIQQEQECSRIAVNGLNAILESCRHLRVFEAIASRIEADHLLERPWVCEDLEVFRCQIIGFSRLDSDEKLVYNESVQVLETTKRELISKEQQRIIDKHQRHQEQHRRVYKRLASLTKLTTLGLGHDIIPPSQRNRRNIKYRRYSHDTCKYIVEPNPIMEAIERSLPSGLARLGTLKNLRVFEFGAPNHEINEPELEWMAKAWPCLSGMFGLHYVSTVAPFENSPTWKLRKRMETLRPDVWHDRTVFEDGYSGCLGLFPFGDS